MYGLPLSDSPHTLDTRWEYRRRRVFPERLTRSAKETAPMKASDFASLLRAIAGMLAKLGVIDKQEIVATLTRIFDASPSATVSAIVKRLRTMEINSSQTHPSLGDAADVLGAAGPLISLLAKSAVRKDAELVEAFL